MSTVTKIWRNRLPHWEVDVGNYFITIRCADSLPQPILLQIREIHFKLQSIDVASREFSTLQRQYFLTAEKYLDQGHGFCPFKEANIAQTMCEFLNTFKADGWSIQHFVVMPNHIHVVANTSNKQTKSLKKTWQQFKGKTAFALNKQLGRQGSFWQPDWFDRWIRDEIEYEKTVRYIRNNPIKAKIADVWQNYRWLK